MTIKLDKTNKKLHSMTTDTFAQLAPRMRNAAKRAARVVGCGVEDAEDVASEVMLALWSIRGQLLAPTCATYASVSARHMAMKMLRNRQSIVSLDLCTPPDQPVPSPEDEAISTEVTRRLLALIDTLPATQQAILRLRQVEMLSKKEISLRLGIAETSVATLLARARRTMYNNLKNNPEQ